MFESQFQDDQSDDDMVRCPSCNWWIHEETERCPSCGNYITEEDEFETRAKPWWVIVGAVVLLIVIFMFWI